VSKASSSTHTAYGAQGTAPTREAAQPAEATGDPDAPSAKGNAPRNRCYLQIMARISSGTMVAALTLAALAAVGVLAAQASGSAPSGAPGPQAGQSVKSSPSPRPSASATRTYALPSGSGTGTGARVVYSLDQDRVWLVDSADQITRTYTVVPGTVDPAPGTYTVVSRTLSGMGGDGVPIEHVVRFTTADGVVIGFSAARDGALPTAGASSSSEKTGGIREARADGTALWEAAPLGAKVVVVR
jgi:hypothetical protein